DFGGSVNRGGGSSSALLWMSRTSRQAIRPSAAAMRWRSPPLRSWDRWGRPLRARLARAVRGPGCGV
ncbi:hypothetical protein AB0D92_30765, partial [Streptomyces parvus]|uniref:hypothetical protein n=1 Tax=Streptomyces parvus TaxID=66428 RepID=UPI0033CA3E31